MHPFVLILIALLTLDGCATLIDGTTQELSFQSNPEEVTVTLLKEVSDSNSNDVERRILGKTPLTLQLDREEKQKVLFEKAGYKPLTMNLTTTLNGMFWGNIVFGGLIGSTTDSTSGASTEYSPSQYFVTLVSDQSTTIDAAMPSDARAMVRAFIVRRYQHIVDNLVQANGEDLGALFALLNVPPSQETEAKQKLQALSVVYQNAVEFADHVVNLYMKQ